MRIFIGWDDRESVAYHTLAHSIISRATSPVYISPLKRSLLRFHTRERGPLESTEFSITRFLVPYLSNYEGLSLYLDPDMLCLEDISKLFDRACWHWGDLGKICISCSEREAVYVVKHDYDCTSRIKMDGKVQTPYSRKNWSSMMLFNNKLCKRLTPEYVNTANGLDLHQFKWLEDKEIGSVDLLWNWLVGEYSDNPSANILHYTLGGPWFSETKDCPMGDLWLEEHRRLNGTSNPSYRG